MLKHTALALLLIGLALSQTYYTAQIHLDEIRSVKCVGEVPKDFTCAILFSVDPHLPSFGPPDFSVTGGASDFPHTPPLPVIREVSLILDGTLYTAVYEPPLKRDDTFSGLERNVGIPARVDGDNLIVKWPNGKEAKARIIRREKVDPNRPQPA